MKIIVTGCHDCPLKRVSNTDGIICKITQEVLMGPNVGDIDLITPRKTGAECPMLEDAVRFVLNPNAIANAKGWVEAFIGNRVRLSTGTESGLTKGIVVGKFTSPADTSLPIDLVPKSEEGLTTYLVIMDGGETTYVWHNGIAEILDETQSFNYHRNYKFYFGHDEEG